MSVNKKRWKPSRAGRNRSAGEREPNGRLQRSPNRRDQIKDVVREARERHGVPSNFSDNPQSGYVLGWFYYNRDIDRRQHDTGLFIAELIWEYSRHVLNSRPPIAQAIDIARVAGRGMDSLPHPGVDRIKERYAAMQAAIIAVDGPGRAVSKMITRYCITDDRESQVTSDMLDKLRVGLNRVHREFDAEIAFRFAGQTLIQKHIPEKNVEHVD